MDCAATTIQISLDQLACATKDVCAAVNSEPVLMHTEGSVNDSFSVLRGPLSVPGSWSFH